MTHTSGRITKAGRKDLRQAMVNAANHAVQHHVHWKKEMDRLELRLGRSKAIVAIAHKLLVAVWHVLTKPKPIVMQTRRMWPAHSFHHAYKVSVHKNLPKGQSALAFTREQLDRLEIGKDLKQINWGSKPHKLPPSKR